MLIESIRNIPVLASFKGQLKCQALFLLIVSLLIVGSVAAEPKGFDAVHQRYLSLRNVDIDLQRRSEWLAVEGDFLRASREERDPLKAQRSLSELAVLYRIFSEHFDTDWNELRAMAALEELIGRFPSGELADDALIRQAEIVAGRGNVSQQRALLRRVMKEHPSSDMVYVARNQLAGRRTGISQQPSAQKIGGGELPLIVLDPGHGGEDFGALGVAGLLEKDVSLAIALRVKELLEKRGLYQVVLTRQSDRFVPLAERMGVANQHGAEFFLSIHANASENKTLSGVETYYLDNAANKASATLADRENRAGGIGGNLGGDLSFMLSDLIQNAKLPESIALARNVQRAVVRHLKTRRSDVQDLGAKPGPFYVLVGAHMPCALVEVSFIDHHLEGGYLGDRSYREQIAEGIVEGIIASGN